MRLFHSALLFAAVVTAALCGPAAAQDSPRDLLPGKTLALFCDSVQDTDFGLCNGYIMAVADMMAGQNTVFGYRACGHDGVKAQQLADLVRMEIAENPGLTSQSAGTMIAGILARRFPCL